MAAQRDPNSTKQAQNEFNFFWQWLTNKQLPFPLLWWPTGTNMGLVRERVSGFASGESASAEQPHGFEANWAWTGDQGLMLGNFCDAISRQPIHSVILLQMAKGVLARARQKLFQTAAHRHAFPTSANFWAGEQKSSSSRIRISTTRFSCRRMAANLTSRS